jgi:hypothetical protein
MPALRPLPIALAVSCALAAASLAAAPASPASASAECTTPTQNPVCEYSTNEKQAEPTSTATSTEPGAIEPAPVNPVLEAEFEAHVREWDERGKLAIGAQAWEVRLAPGLEGGWVGWCMSVRVSTHRVTRCPVAPRQEGIGYESWEAGGNGTRGIALVNAPSEAVAVDEASTAEVAVPVSGVPGVAAALVEIPEPFPAGSHWFDEFEPVLRNFRSSGGRGFSAPERAYSVGLPATSWRAPEHPPVGVCSMTAVHLPGLTPRFGHVVTSLAPTPGLAGDGFASCVDTEYSLARSSLDAAMLLDAAQPGSATPMPLPSAAPVHHHPGLFSAPGWNGQILARRVGSAWIAVEGGASLRQRIQLLSHLRASVRPASASGR